MNLFSCLSQSPQEKKKSETEALCLVCLFLAALGVIGGPSPASVAQTMVFCHGTHHKLQKPAEKQWCLSYLLHVRVAGVDLEAQSRSGFLCGSAFNSMGSIFEAIS